MNAKYPKIVDGRESLDPKPKVVYMEIDPVTGEITQEGVRPPMSAQEIHRLSTNRFNDYDGHDGSDDDDFDVEEYEDTLIPELSPYQDGFVDRYGPSEAQAIKTLQKAGYAVMKPAGDPEPTPTSDPRIDSNPKPKKPPKLPPAGSVPEVAEGD